MGGKEGERERERETYRDKDTDRDKQKERERERERNHCCSHLLQAFGPDGAVLVNESNTALIDQLVSIVQHILETKVEGALEHLVHVKIDDIVLNLIM